MSLTRSAWILTHPDREFPDYMLILPEKGIIVAFTSMQTPDDKRVVWGCWIREEAESVVYTALRTSKAWRRESYQIRGDELIWDTGTNNNGGVWTKIEEEEIPETLRKRGDAYLEKYGAHSLPEYNPSEAVD